MKPLKKFSDVPGPSVIIPEGVYKIYTHLTNINLISMTLTGAPPIVNLWHENTEPQSKWRITYEEKYEAHLIYNERAPSKSLFVADYSDVFVEKRPIIYRPPHFWAFKSAGDKDVYFIESMHNFHVLDVNGSNMADGTRIIAWPYKGSANQKFKLVRV
ncbi:RICIN domain-containing protein [Pseudomonas gingeri]|jgi:hypothetical protein|uniref:RICIN domain-containing protein n=2 Tax=Pseudomonas gingeri TaxID=117681 RepID=A0A7Y7WKF0_9PSED|nr:RICIN domain-containing protein [Pseudomonas gingeri]